MVETLDKVILTKTLASIMMLGAFLFQFIFGSSQSYSAVKEIK